jgi:hypothetical protein
LVLLTRTSVTTVLWTIPWLVFVLYQAAFRGMVVRQFFAHPIITTIGGMCYTIYLLHNYTIYALGLFNEKLFGAAGYELRLLLLPWSSARSALYRAAVPAARLARTAVETRGALAARPAENFRKRLNVKADSRLPHAGISNGALTDQTGRALRFRVGFDDHYMK